MIKKTLLDLGLIDEKNIRLFAERTRDKNNVQVFRDKMSGLIFIDDFYVGEKEYQEGKYRKMMNDGNLENFMDIQRRWKDYAKFAVGKRICDFGCGSGDFLRLAKPYAKSIYGVEIQKDYNLSLNKEKIRCFTDIDMIKEKLDTFFLFHTFEHLPDPINTLKEIYSKLDTGGKIIIEVPHVRDFLFQIPEFKDFTLWSQHLILHTRQSLERFLIKTGFGNIQIQGVQRYGLSNHMEWFKNRKPGGHTKDIIETEELKRSYAAALSAIDANDTLVAIGEK